MSENVETSVVRRESKLGGETVVVIGGSAGMGLETGRLARAEGADVILTARNPERLESAASELGAAGTATTTWAGPSLCSARMAAFMEEPVASPSSTMMTVLPRTSTGGRPPR